MAAFIYAQLEKLDEIQQKRLKIYNAYNKVLKPFEKEDFLRLPVVPNYARHNSHLYYILFNDNETRNRIMTRIKERGILAIFHYILLHSSPMGMKIGYNHGDLPITESISERLLRLPLCAGMTDEELNYTISNVKEEI